MKRGNHSDDSEDLEEIEDESADFIEEPRSKRLAKSSTGSAGSNKKSDPPAAKTLSITNGESWVDKYSPKTTADICINPTKLKQLKELMEEMINYQNRRILVLTGPSGSSKSTSAKLLSEAIGKGNVEYFNNTSSSNHFNEFLNDCKYLIGKNMKFIIIEELPNIFHKPILTSFREKLLEWLYLNQTLPPIIICLTEIERNFGSQDFGGKFSNEFFNIENNLNINTVLGKEILSHPKVGVIKFNSIANKFMKSTMNLIIKQELKIFKLIPQKQVNDFLSQINDIGDIRSSINNLELWSRFYHRGINLVGGNDGSYNRNTTINLFHAIGKILYSSSKFKSTSLSNDDSNFLTIEEVLNNYENLQLLNLSILENYTTLLSDDNLTESGFMADRLSESDLIYHLMEGKDLMIRSVRVGLDRAPPHSNNKFNRITFSKNFNMIKLANKINKKIHKLKDNPVFCHGSYNTINLLDGYYVPLIINGRHKQNFSRVGGSLKGISLDDDLFGDSNDLEQAGNVGDDYDDFDAFDKFSAHMNDTYVNSNVVSVNDLEDELLSDPVEDSDEDQKKPLPFESDYEFLDESDFL